MNTNFDIVFQDKSKRTQGSEPRGSVYLMVSICGNDFEMVCSFTRLEDCFSKHKTRDIFINVCIVIVVLTLNCLL